MADLLILDNLQQAMRTLVDQGNNTYAPEVALSPTRRSRTRTPVTVKAAGIVAGAGIHSYTFDSTNWRGMVVFFVGNALAGAGVTLSLSNSFFGNGVFLGPASAALVANSNYAYEVGPGASGPAPGGTLQFVGRVAGGVTDSTLVLVNHLDANNQNYTILAAPTEYIT